MSKATIQPPLKWHGGKGPLARRIVNLFPARCKNSNAPAADDWGYVAYVEPYFGGGAVLFANDPEGISEVANDADGNLVNFWKVLQDPSFFHEFERRAQAAPVCETLWEEADAAIREHTFFGPVDRAVRFFVQCRQSLAGRRKSFAPLSRNRTRRGMNEQASAWLNAVDGLPAVHARLKRVAILNQDALDVIKSQDGPRTLFYLDPPYAPGSRTAPNVYAHEMTIEQHNELLNLLATIKGRFLLSGYRNDLYDQKATVWLWKRHDFEVPNHAAGGDSKRRMVESVWANW